MEDEDDNDDEEECWEEEQDELASDIVDRLRANDASLVEPRSCSLRHVGRLFESTTNLFRDFFRALHASTVPTILDLHDTKLGDEFDVEPGNLVRLNTTVTSLDLRGSGLGPGWATEIAQALRTNTTLTEVILCENEIEWAMFPHYMN